MMMPKLQLIADFQILRKIGDTYIAVSSDEISWISVGAFSFDTEIGNFPFDFMAWGGSWDEDSSTFHFESGKSLMPDYHLCFAYEDEYKNMGINIQDINAKLLAETTYIEEFYVQFDAKSQDGFMQEIAVGDGLKNSVYKLYLKNIALVDCYEGAKYYNVSPNVIADFNSRQ